MGPGEGVNGCDRASGASDARLRALTPSMPYVARGYDEPLAEGMVGCEPTFFWEGEGGVENTYGGRGQRVKGSTLAIAQAAPLMLDCKR